MFTRRTWGGKCVRPTGWEGDGCATHKWGSVHVIYLGGWDGGEQSQHSAHTYNISGRHSPARVIRRSNHLYMVKTMRCKGVGTT